MRNIFWWIYNCIVINIVVYLVLAVMFDIFVTLKILLTVFLIIETVSWLLRKFRKQMERRYE